MATHRLRRDLWLPVGLRKLTLLGFAFLFAAVAVSLAAVYRYSLTHDGIATPETRFRYFWTYCPSALFIIISGLWTMVDCNTKLLAPWQAMAATPTTASKSISLDYTSKNQFSTLYKSFRNSHWNVSLAVTGTLLLDLLVILSTGLFRVKAITSAEPNFDFQLTTQLNRTGTVQQAGDGLMTALAISQQKLAYPKGTAKDFAYTTIDTSDLSPNTTAYANVDAVHIDVDCEIANASWSYGVVYDVIYLNGTAGAKVEASTKECGIQYAVAFENPALLDAYNFGLSLPGCSRPGDPQSFTRRIMAFGGSMTVKDMNITEARKKYSNATREDVSGDGTSFFLPIRNRTLSSKAVAVICEIRPRLRNASVAFDGNSWTPTLIDSANRTLGTEESDILGKNKQWNMTLSSGLQLSIIQSLTLDFLYLMGGNPPLPNSPSDVTIDTWSSYHTPFFSIMNNTFPRKTVKEMVDSDLMATTFSAALQLVMSQLAGEFLFSNLKGHTTGMLIVKTNRLVMSPLAFGLVVGLLVLIFLITMTILIKSTAVIPRDPSSTASKAIILARSAGVINFARRVSCCQWCSQGESHSPDRFKIRNISGTGQTQFSIELSTHNNPSCSCETSSQVTISPTWWDPWSASLVCRLLAILVPCIGISLLEGLQRISDRNHGIAGVTLNGYSQFAWIYIPVIVIFIMNTVFTSISSTNRILQPYAAMRQKPYPAARTLSVDLVNRLTVSALYLAVKLAYFGTAASLFATLLGATLPIAASGLFHVKPFQHERPIALKQSSSFNPLVGLAVRNTSQDFYPIPGLVLYQNMSSPRWTFGKYALPKVTMDRSFTSNLSMDAIQSSILSVDLPAVFGTANCSLLSDDAITYSAVPTELIDAKYDILMEAKVSPECPSVTLPMKTTTSDNFFITFREAATSDDFFTTSREATTSDDFFLASWEAFPAARLLNSTLTSGVSTLNKTLATYHGDAPIPPACPLSFIVIAKGKHQPGTNKNKTATLTVSDSFVFQCSPHVKQEMLSVTFSLPDFDISPSQPPVPKAGTTTFFSEAEIVNTATFYPYLPSHPRVIDPKIPGLRADPFFQAAFGAVGGIMPSSLIGQRDDVTEKLLQRIEYVYGTVVAQLYDGKRRVPESEQDPLVVFHGTLETPGQTRIKQDELSTRIIQGVLAAMMVCAITSMLMIDGRRLLPRNPCSIAAVASLLAYSSILQEEFIPLGLEILREKELLKKGVLKHGMYSLGWWEIGGQRWYGIDMGRAEK